MSRLRFVLLAAASTAWAAGAAAQVTVPLPGGHGAPTLPPPMPAPPTSVPLPSPGQPPASVPPAVSTAPPDINPYHRDIEMTVPLTYRQRVLGDIPILLTHDSRFIVYTDGFLKLIEPLLNEKARVSLRQLLGPKRSFSPQELAQSGIALEYDPGTLSVVVLRINAQNRAVEALFDAPHASNEKPDLMPAHVAGFMNINLTQDAVWNGHTPPPALYLNGALRIDKVVFEWDFRAGQETDLSSSHYTIDRNYARFVYDEPDEYRRWYLGDLTPETRGQQTFVQMGGIGVSREVERFDQTRSAILQGNRQLILQTDATVSILRNGSLYREMRLEPGAYDLSSLPLTAGSNDIQVVVHDASGAVQNLDYQSYYDPIDLAPGDYEYGAYLGATSNRLGQTPHYTGEVAFTGFYRKAFLNRPAIGVGLQLSRSVQQLTGQTQYILGNGARVLLDGGVSHSDQVGPGYSAGIAYDQIFDRSGLVDALTFRIDYLSRRFAGLGNESADNSSAVDLTAQYTHAFSQLLSVLFGATYTKTRSSYGDSYRFSATTAYRLSRSWSVRGGVDYTRYGNTGGHNGLGVLISLVFQPSYRDRAELRHDSSINDTSLSYLHSGDSRIGSLSYGATAEHDDETTSVQGFADYTANRFDLSISHAAYGDSFGGIDQRQITSVRLGTAIAFADGAFGIGRRINDSFAILYPHSNLGNRSVVAGQSLANNDYLSKSGALGGAVNGFLSSYVVQSIQYDVQDPPVGYDIGPGVVRVRPPYHSGYKLRIGTDRFVSAVGTLDGPDGKPLALAGGRVVAIGLTDDETVPFFTNSVGRFAIANLRPGTRYRVELFSLPKGFEFDVPAKPSSVINLNVVNLKPAG